MEDDLIINNQKIEDLIYNIRGKQVMLDSDLAILYHVETKRINEAVYRNVKKFPSRFCWELTDDESKSFLVANCDQKKETRGGRFKNPRVFTEQGVMMLATILKTDVAVETTIRIMDAFVWMKKYISNELLEQNSVYSVVMHNQKRIIELEKAFKKLKKDKKETEIFYSGQFFDAYSKIYEIVSSAKKNIIIIDAYADCTILDIVKRINIDVVIITRKNKLLTKQDIDRYKSQYNNLRVVYSDDFHDRYFILDSKYVYHCGTSVNKIGRRTFSINKASDGLMIDKFIDSVNSLIE